MATTNKQLTAVLNVTGTGSSVSESRTANGRSNRTIALSMEIGVRVALPIALVLLLVELAVGRAGRVNHQRLGVAHIGKVARQFHAVDELDARGF